MRPKRSSDAITNDGLRAFANWGVDESALRVALERMKLDRTATLEDQLRGLSACSFREVTCSYKNLIFAVYSAVK